MSGAHNASSRPERDGFSSRRVKGSLCCDGLRTVHRRRTKDRVSPRASLRRDDHLKRGGQPILQRRGSLSFPRNVSLSFPRNVSLSFPSNVSLYFQRCGRLDVDTAWSGSPENIERAGRFAIPQRSERLGFAQHWQAYWVQKADPYTSLQDDNSKTISTPA